MSNLHLLLDEANKHTPKGFDNVGAKNYRPWKDELSESTYTENFQLPRAINFVDGTVAAPTSVNGDIYVLTGAGVIDPSWGTSTFGDWTRATNTIFTPITPIKGALCYDDTASQWKEFDGAAWISHDANATNLAIANITATNLDVTSDTGTDATVPAATVSDAGLMTAAKFNEVVANNAKVTNVSTDLTEGTTTNTTVAVNSSDGLNALLLAASTTRAGVMTKAKFDEVVVNNSKVSDIDHNATHTGEMSGATALTAQKTLISNKTLVTAVGTDHVLIGDASDADNLKKVLVSDFLGGGSNLYTADGSLTAARTVTMGAFALTFSGNTTILKGLNQLGTVGNSALIVQDSTGANLLDVRNDGTLIGAFPVAAGSGTDSFQTNGVGATASGDKSIAFGFSASAGASSTALGQLASATFIAAVAVGVQSNSSANYGVSIGYQSIAAISSVGLGHAANATSTGCIAVGNTANASGAYGIAIGTGATSATNTGSLAIGRACDSTGLYSIAIGTSARATSSSSMMFAAAAADKINNTAKSVEFNFDETTSTIRIGQSVDSWINTSANFGIGHTAPTAKLHVVGSTLLNGNLGVFGTTPIAQPTTGVASSVIVAGAGTNALQDDTYGGYTMAQVVQALQNLGVLA